MNERQHYQDIKRSFPATAPAFLLPPVIWAVVFATLYAVQGAGCSGGLGATIGAEGLRVLLIVIAGIGVLGIVMVGLLSWRRFRHLEETDSDKEARHLSHFLALGSLLNAALFLVATSWTSVPLFMMDGWLRALIGVALVGFGLWIAGRRWRSDALRGSGAARSIT